MKISVIGGGYVGLVTGTCLADLGNEVTIIEIDQGKVDLIKNARLPIYERGLDTLIARNLNKNLQVTASYDSIAASDLTFICVGTPSKPDGSPDLQYIESACNSLGAALKQRDGRYHVVVVKSTVPPGTTENVIRGAILRHSGRNEDEIGFVSNPEFLREGIAIDDFMHPDRIVIGSSTTQAGDRLAQVYTPISAPVLRTGLTAAEMIKYASNAFLATKISFSNEIGNICKKLGIDVYEVMEGVGMDHRINPLFLNAGLGFGGSCFPKDISALVNLAKSTGENPVLLKSVLEINTLQPHRIIRLLELRMGGSVRGRRIAVLGLAFKENTDDIRDSRAIPVIQDLIERGAYVVAFDPMAVPNMQRIFPAIHYAGSAAEALNSADACLILTEWPEFSYLSSEFEAMKQQIIIEGRRVLTYPGHEGICW